MKITIHRALAELKLIDSKIEKAIETAVPSGWVQKDGKVNSMIDKEEFTNDVRSKYQKITDLINRKAAIKSAIVKANSETEVKIADNTMFIVDAINFKNIVSAKKDLINRFTRVHTNVKGQVLTNNERVKENAMKLAEAALGKDNVKIGENDVESITKPYLENNTFELIDPMNCDKLIETLQNEVDEFETEVDAVLSEINAVTLIEI